MLVFSGGNCSLSHKPASALPQDKYCTAILHPEAACLLSECRLYCFNYYNGVGKCKDTKPGGSCVCTYTPSVSY
ncbi:hypothetical protein AALP_AA6G249100 [Arabis alpina]|uniref:Uncharacterized protein n=1 Tax=Arabis alpina TaxID=50452 RepID=A0A087GRI6_ARAAL|nr:hypothetical protein AALP_AA6G249100 [Arabis alpina]